MRLANPKALEEWRARLEEAAAACAHLPKVRVCAGTGCLANGSAKVRAAFEAEACARGMTLPVDFAAETTGCHGFCERGPLVVIEPGGILYEKVKPGDVPEIFEKTILRERWHLDTLCRRIHSVRIEVRTEAYDGTILPGICLHTLEYLLAVLKHAGGLV